MTDAQFNERTARLLASIEVTIDQWLQADVIDIDAHRSGGMLDLTLPNRSHLVINTQPPLHELWLAAQSGGYHYKFVDGQWLNTRDGTEFFAAMTRCASEQAGQTLEFKAPD